METVVNQKIKEIESKYIFCKENKDSKDKNIISQVNKNYYEIERIITDKILENTLDLPSKQKLLLKSKDIENFGFGEIIRTIVDSLQFFDERTKDHFIALLKFIFLEESLEELYDEELVFFTAQTLYYLGIFEYCYDFFEIIVKNHKISLVFRVESIKFLYHSENESYTKLVSDELITIISNDSYDSQWKYEIIASYFSKYGIPSKFSNEFLSVKYKESFLYLLQITFFFNENNGIRQRILSASHLLSMKCLTESERTEVIEILFEFAEMLEVDRGMIDEMIVSERSKNPELSDTEQKVLFDKFYNQKEKEVIRIKSDALDVINFYSGIDAAKEKALKLIDKIGEAEKDKLVKNSIEYRAFNVYNNKENVHKFMDKIVKVISGLGFDRKVLEGENYENMVNEITKIAKNYTNDGSKLISYQKGISRIGVDSSSITEHSITMQEFLLFIWKKIKSNKNVTEKKTLEERLVEELIDMGEDSGTCTSGHYSRLLNVLSGFDIVNFTLIDFKLQMIENVSARLMFAIKSISDENTEEKISIGAISEKGSEERKIYEEFINYKLSEIKKDLREEFVDGCLIGESEFEEYFEESKVKWL